jgi:hypothetical protein
MNTLVKSAIAGALTLGAGSAFALGVPSENSSDLVLIVENETTFATYALDTGISLDSILPTGSLVPGAVLNTSLAGINQQILASPTLQAFLLANPAAGDAWTLEGGQYNGGGASSTNSNTVAPGAAKAVFTSNIGTINNAVLQSKNLGAFEAYQNGFNADVTQTNGGLFPLLSATETTAAADTASQAEVSANSKYNMLGAPDLAALGTGAIQLFGFTANGNPGVLQSYLLGSATLANNGTLTITGNGVTAPVPLPAAVWLFGSGLMGLVGVSRRRKAAVAVA